MSQKRSLFQNGAFVGAMLGGVTRGLLAFYNMGGDWSLFILLALLCVPSVALGALCGGLAGASRTPLRGVLWGGLLAGLTFAAFVVPVAWIATLFNAAKKVEQFSMPLLAQRVFLGALVGAVAAEIGRRGRGKATPGTTELPV